MKNIILALFVMFLGISSNYSHASSLIYESIINSDAKDSKELIRNREQLNEIGIAYYDEGGSLHIGVKDDYYLEFNKAYNKKENIFILEKSMYSLNELIEEVETISKDFMQLRKDNTIYSIEIREDIQKIILYTNGLDEQTIKYLYEKYSNILIENNGPNKRPVLEIFNDIKTTDWFYLPIKNLYDRGLIKGYSNKSFKSNSFISREEAAQIAYKVASIPVMEESRFEKLMDGFIDVGDERWSSVAINYLKKNKIMFGRDENRFYPETQMTREEAAVLANRVLDFRNVPRMEDTKDSVEMFSDSKEISTWAKDEVNILYKNSIIKGYADNTFKPKESITRAEFTSIMHKVLELIETNKQL